MRVPETGLPKTVSLFSSTTSRPPRATEIFEAPLEAFASAFGCATNFIVLVYSPARLARNSCSGPGFVASGVRWVSGVTSGFWGPRSWAKTAVAARSNSAASKGPRPRDGAIFISISFTIIYTEPGNDGTYEHQNIVRRTASIGASGVGPALNACVRLFRLCHRAGE